MEQFNAIEETTLRNLPLSTFKVFKTCGYLYPLKDKHWGSDLDIIAAALAQYAQPKILDAGCGTGWHLRSISQAQPKLSGLTGLDFSPDMLSLATELSSSAGLADICFVQGNLVVIPFEASSFDVVLCLNNTLGNLPGESFHCASDVRRRVSQELSTIVKPGGSLILSAYNVEKVFEEEDYGSVFLMDHTLSRPASHDFVIRFFDPCTGPDGGIPYYSHWFTCNEVMELIEQAGLLVKSQTLRERRIITVAQKPS